MGPENRSEACLREVRDGGKVVSEARTISTIVTIAEISANPRFCCRDAWPKVDLWTETAAPFNRRSSVRLLMVALPIIGGFAPGVRGSGLPL